MKRALIALGAVALIAGGTGGLVALADTSGTASASCGAPNATTGTAPCTGTWSVNVPVPTVTTTVTVTATPTTTPPPPPSVFAPGENVNATNTGIAGDGVTPAQLTAVSNPTYSTSGTAAAPVVISNKAFTGEVNVTGNYITIKDCTDYSNGSNAFDINLAGSNDIVQNCTVGATSGGEVYEGVMIQPGTTGDQVVNVDSSHGENLITTYGNNVTIKNSYLHDSCGCGDPDGIELYGGSNVAITNNRINYNGVTEAPINIAPWSNYKVQGVAIKGNFLDYGQAMLLVDNQNTSCGGGTQPVGDCLINVVVEGNAMGGHTDPNTFGRYMTLENYESRTIAQDDAAEAANPNDIEMPTSGANANEWQETQTAPALTPNKDGVIVQPTCPNSPC